MTAAVVADGVSLVLRDLLEVVKHVFDRLVGPFGALERAVDIVYVRLVVLAVMKLHRLLVDVRLERVVVVGERWKFVGHSPLLFGTFRDGRSCITPGYASPAK